MPNDTCVICGKQIRIQIQKGTGLCSRDCEKIKEKQNSDVQEEG